MTESMVERVKHAIYDAAVEKPYATDLEPMARAVIEAMREPTEAMLSAGASNLGDLDVEFAPHSETLRGASECWRDMIDAALKDDPS